MKSIRGGRYLPEGRSQQADNFGQKGLPHQGSRRLSATSQWMWLRGTSTRACFGPGPAISSSHVRGRLWRSNFPNVSPSDHPRDEIDKLFDLHSRVLSDSSTIFRFIVQKPALRKDGLMSLPNMAKFGAQKHKVGSPMTEITNHAPFIHGANWPVI